MSDAFVGQYFELTLYYTANKNKFGVITVKPVAEAQAHTMLADEKQKDKIKKITTKWLYQSWTSATDVVKQSMQYDHVTGESKFAPHLYRTAKLKSCLVDWDCKEDDGTPIPCNEMTIGQLQYPIAAALLDLYEEAMTPDSEEQVKN